MREIAETEVLPEVSFDIALGKKYSQVDFDYDGYKRLVYSMGGDQDDFEATKIKVGPRRYLGILQGSYNSREGLISCNTSPTKINNNLAHETRHYLDIRDEIVSRRAPIAANLSILGLMGMTGVTWVTNIGQLIPVDTVNNVAEHLNNGSLLGSALAMLAFARYYYFSAEEKRARAAEKNEGYRQIITLSR